MTPQFGLNTVVRAILKLAPSPSWHYYEGGIGKITAGRARTHSSATAVRLVRECTAVVEAAPPV